MTEPVPPTDSRADQSTGSPQDIDHNRQQRAKRNSSRRGGRSPESTDQQRQSRSRIDRAMFGYGDGIERATCLSVASIPPRTFPVQHRTGVAVIPLAVVDRTPNAVLLCDQQHDGPHTWPNGDVVGEPVIEIPIGYADQAVEPE